MIPARQAAGRGNSIPGAAPAARLQPRRNTHHGVQDLLQKRQFVFLVPFTSLFSDLDMLIDLRPMLKLHQFSL